MSLVSGNLIVPTILWGRRAPSHRACCVRCLPDGQTILTGTVDGQIIIWRLDNGLLKPKYMLFGHSRPISCLCPTGVDSLTTRFVSTSDDGKMCLWESVDGRCIDSVTTVNVHRYIYAHPLRSSAMLTQLRLFCVGDYPEIIVMDPQDLTVLFTLSSRVEPDWVSALFLLKHPQKNDIAIGISLSGMVKIWSMTEIDKRDSSNPVYEDESKSIAVRGALTVSSCAQNQRTMLVVSSSMWQIFDASEFSELLQQEPPQHHSCLGGAFTRIDRVAIWCTDGAIYLYQLPRSAAFGEKPQNVGSKDNAFIYCVLNIKQSNLSTLTLPDSCFHFETRKVGQNQHIQSVYRADATGRLAVWDIPDVAEKTIAALMQEQFKEYPEVLPNLQKSLEGAWKDLPEPPKGFIDHNSEEQTVTSTLYVPSQGRLVLGHDDGSILLVYAAHALMKQLLDIKMLQRSPDWPPVRMLSGHSGAVTCLLYPHEEHPRYEPHHLLSGGADFAVFLWDLNSGARIHRFCVQAGPILRMVIPPENCNSRILQTVCSVASDHSVALLGLKETKCLLLASRHLFPVKEIRWRPLDDFLLVRCEDDTVYVWQMETANLDRIVSGLLADEVWAACDEQVGVIEGDDQAGASSAMQMFRALRNKNVAAIKQIAAPTDDKAAGAADVRDLVLPAPMTVQGMKAFRDDGESHLILFHVDALIMGLLADEQMTTAPSSIDSTADRATTEMPSFSGLLARAKDKAENVLQMSPSTQPRSADRAAALSGRSTFQSDGSLQMDVAHVLMSLLHGWTLDKDLDHVCVKKLGLLRPKAPVCFGLVSRQGHLSMLLPTGIEVGTKFEDRFELFARNIHWQLSASLTTQHLLSVIATANTLMSMQHAAFSPDQEKKRKLLRRLSSTGSRPPPTGVGQTAQDSSAVEQAQIKQGWSLLAALHCVLLPELVNKGSYCPPRIELLARRWQDRCLELREAAQALLIRELNRLGPNGRKGLIDSWAPFLPLFLDPSLSIFGSRILGGSPSPQPPITSTTTAVANTPGVDEPKVAALTDINMTDPTQLGSHESGLQQVRRNQATAVVLLGVIGAEFGQEIAQHGAVVPQHAKSSAPEGFSESDHSLARATSQSLLELLLQPPSVLLPPHSPLRRAAIDLIGRGFSVWQPYLDISKVLLGLLDLAANSDKMLQTGQIVLPLSPPADACRTAKHALTLIASARPPAFITALSKEVARYNSAAQHQTIQHTVTSPLLKSRTEVLRIIEQLAEKQYGDVADLMIAVGEVLVHCLDTSLLKHRSLAEIFPPITKFYMVAYCPNSRRIAFGGKTGVVVIHELRAGKAQTIQAHSRPVTAVAFSEDGKHLATYSADEGKVNFWQTSVSFLGMGQSQIKCVKQQPAPTSHPVTTPGGSPGIFRARLVWINSRSLTLMLPNNKEHRFAM